MQIKIRKSFSQCFPFDNRLTTFKTSTNVDRLSGMRQTVTFEVALRNCFAIELHRQSTKYSRQTQDLARTKMAIFSEAMGNLR